MAVTPVTSDQLKLPTTPDLSRLAGMSNRTVMVTRSSGRAGAERLVVDGTGPWAAASVESILGLPGVIQGSYGPGTYRFLVQDGTDGARVEWMSVLGNDQPEVHVNGANGASSGATRLDADTIELGGGARFNERLGIITTRDGRFYPWRAGDPLPNELRGAGGGWGTMSTTAPPSTPISNTFESLRVQELEQRLADADRRREEAERKREMDEIRSTFQRMQEATDKRFELLIAKLAEKPAGPTAQEQALQARLDAMERQQQDRAREDALRAEMRVSQERTDALIRELKESKTDPMMPVLLQLLQGMQASNAAQGSIAKDIATLITDRFGATQMTPERLLEVVRMAKDRGADTEVMKNALEMYKQLFGMSQEVLRMQAEMNTDGVPWWGHVIQEGVGKLGQAANVYAATQAQRQQQAQRPAQRPPQRQQPRPAPAPAAAAPPAETQPPQQPQPRGRGRKATNGANGAAKAPPAPPPAAVSTGSPGVDSIAKLREMPPDEVRQLLANENDESVFGSLAGTLAQVREAVAAGGKPEAFAERIGNAYTYYTQAGEVCPAYELIGSGHFDILLERLVPDAPLEYRAEVAQILRDQMESDDEEGDDASDGPGEGAPSA